MFPPFPEEKAASVLAEILKGLSAGEIFLRRKARPSEERKNLSVMLGVLVCEDSGGTEVRLAAVSGNAWSLSFSGGEKSQIQILIVPPVVSANKIAGALSKNDDEIHRLTERLNELKELKSKNLLLNESTDCGKKSLSEIDSEFTLLEEKRRNLCDQSLRKVLELYEFFCIDGKTRTISEICRSYNRGKLPPTGTGDCTAPRLFDFAFRNGLRPLSLAETRLGSQVPVEPLCLVPPCDARCAIVLPSMLGIKILYRDEHIIVVDKESGLLSVPGRGPDKQDCVVARVRRLFPSCIEQPAVHRLDMETSGIMVLAFTKEAHRNLNRQFEEGRVKKEYVALLDGNLPKMKIEMHGVMELYFRLDVDNRPHQIWDSEHGKKAVTEWQVLGVERYTAPDGSVRNVTRVLFKPHTGRTHQLRLASSDSHGFGVPIVGDTLYGSCAEGERLMLHAQRISFAHPNSGERLEFFCPAEF